LVSEQVDRSATGRWGQGGFILDTSLSEDELRSFFACRYRPSPIANPWNGAGGFYCRFDKLTGRRDRATTATRALTSVTESTAERLAPLRLTIELARAQVEHLGLQEAPKDVEKAALVNRLRDRLPDEAVAWLDAVLIVDPTDLGFPPVLGTGGTEGALDFGSNFYQRLADVFDFSTGAPTSRSASLLGAALFDEAVSGLSKAAIGQFDPGSAGGGNAAPGFDGKSVVNPWDFILLIEGTLVLASATTRKLETAEPGALTYPFSVRSVGAGYASADAADEGGSRHELWLPLWTGSTGLAEVVRLFGEGRVEIGRRRAVHAVDFARAIGALGVDRGIRAFTRFGFHKRNGKSYFATPLGRWKVRRNPTADLIDDDLARWLDRLRAAARGKHAPKSWSRAAKGVENAVLVLASKEADGGASVRALMAALANAEAVLSATPAGREIPPVPPLRGAWLLQAADRSPEHALAQSLASTRIRERLTRARWTGRRTGWMSQEDHKTAWGNLPALRGMAQVALRVDVESTLADGARRVLDRWKPRRVAPLWDALRAFLEDEVDLDRLEALVRGYSLVDPARVQSLLGSASRPWQPPPGWSLCALAAHRHHPTDPDASLPRTPGLVASLLTGDGLAATALAARRLRAAGAPLAISAVPMTRRQALRVAASLVFPLSPQLAGQALRSVTLTTASDVDCHLASST